MMADNLLESMNLIANVSDVFREKLIDGLKPDKARCRSLIEQSLAMCTSLAPVIGYDKAAAIAKQAFSEGRTVREVALDLGVLDKKKLDELLEPWSMTEPGVKE